MPARQPVFNLPPATKLSVILLLAVHGLLLLVGQEARFVAWERWGFVPLLLAEGRHPETLVTHIFLHGDWMHLLFNGGFLMAFGALVERRLGMAAFLAIFLVSGIAGALAVFVTHTGTHDFLIGASGAVYGIVGAAIRLYFLPRQGWRGALKLVLVLMALNLLFALVGPHLFGAQIGWQAHAGGFVAGILLAIAWPVRRA